MPPAARSLSLDLLRACAILLVMVSHMAVQPSVEDGWLRPVMLLLKHGGWVGVDVFFVLSGFLVGGLLLKEHQTTGSLQVGRFFLRRGCKIWPLLWVVLAFLVLVRGSYHGLLEGRHLFAELFFFANYRPGIVGVTWSLSVEEHFYLLLPPLLLLLAHFGRGKADPFRALPYVVGAVALVCLGLRGLTTVTDPLDLFVYFTPTHLRIDGLFFGVVLAYWHTYHRVRFSAWAQKYRAGLVVAGVLGLLPAFFLVGAHWYMRVPGFALNWLAAGALVCAMVGWQPRGSLFLRAVASIGRQSYATYLVHYWISTTGVLLLCRVLGLQSLLWEEYMGLYLGLSLGVGTFLTWAIEQPVLAWRDRFLPSARDRRVRLAPELPSSAVNIPSVA